MASKTGAQLTVARNATAAETVAATFLDLLQAASPMNAREASSLRLARKHVDELFELTDLTENEIAELKDTHQYGGSETGGNRFVPEPAYANGQG
jgi:hypothetical protein